MIDMDGGIDDALALVLALKSPEIEVVGITAVSGNVPVDQATLNALRVVELLDRQDVWVARGRARPLARDPIRAFTFHGRDGLGDSHLPLPKLRASKISALNAIADTLSSSKKHEVSIVCTGPLTNLATLLIENPDARKQIHEIVIMAGAYGITEYGVGNETPVAEFNVYSDPEAAKLVLETGRRLKAVGLDVTMMPKLELGKHDYSRIKRGKSKVAIFAKRILERVMEKHGRFSLHDPLAVGVKVTLGFYKFSDYFVEVETKGQYTTGMTVTDRRGWLARNQHEGGPVSICTDIDPDFKRLFLKRLTEA